MLSSTTIKPTTKIPSNLLLFAHQTPHIARDNRSKMCLPTGPGDKPHQTSKGASFVPALRPTADTVVSATKSSASFSESPVTSSAAFPSFSHNAPAILAAVGNFLSSMWKRKYKIFLWSFLGLLAFGCVSFTTLYFFSPGFRRTIQFWKSMAPIAMKYKFLKFKSFRIDKLTEDDDLYKQRLEEFNLVTAPKIVNLMLELGGIYIKIGQVMSTIGQGLLPPQYIEALQPLQNGVPARPFHEIKDIVEKSTGMPLEENFISFEEQPIGSASIAQAHVAVLKRKRGKSNSNSNSKNNVGDLEGEKVIVKVQYPDVAENFNADLDNMELVTRWVAPQNIELAKALRERHERELDFRIEADNLREVRKNMQGHNLEPRLVRIPRVVDHVDSESGTEADANEGKSLCTQHVLVMEFLDGVPLSKVIEAEQVRMAKAMGMKNGKGDTIVDVKEYKEELAKRMRQHFEQGGGAGDDADSMAGLFGGSSSTPKLAQVSLPFLARVFRGYVGLKENIDSISNGVQNLFKGKDKSIVGSTVNGDSTSDLTPSYGKTSNKKFNLSRILKTLVHVHGIQMLKDGCYNADPHPGNVVILNDGRVGLLDYGMVGRLKDEDRIAVSKTVVALSENDKRRAASIYRDAGYKATWKNGYSNAHDDDHILHRFATFHLDKIDLSPVTLQNGEEITCMELFRSAREISVPEWVEQARRLGGLLMGVSAQAARPISLSEEWRSIARDVVKSNEKQLQHVVTSKQNQPSS